MAIEGANHGFAITPSDTVVLEPRPRAIYVGNNGHLAVVLVNDDTPVVLRRVQAGSLLPIRVSKVMATGTTAGDLVGLV